jgi:uncharacterized protein YegP (UPF0339 family)
LGAKAYRRPGRRKLDSYQEFGKGVEMAGKFEITKDHAGKFRFHLRAGNGEIIATSQGYGTKESARKGIESVKHNAADAKVEDLTEAHAEAKAAPESAKATPAS